ncbi:Uncharacterized protein TCM_039591 [Theobroma cacao]|uniref:Uncharacterized protein n=1 Tax=Theobroma cacao TaxID=3641 RepID=A0A061GRR5_THECC|nr:Uncharacterized protein TCM_039591 [Theobroma cacao]
MRQSWTFPLVEIVEHEQCNSHPKFTGLSHFCLIRYDKGKNIYLDKRMVNYIGNGILHLLENLLVRCPFIGVAPTSTVFSGLCSSSSLVSSDLHLSPTVAFLSSKDFSTAPRDIH